jgi:hypothetical protein
MPPGTETRREEHQQEAIAVSEGRAFDLSLEHDKLLAQERILSDQLCLPARKIAREITDQGRTSRSRPGTDVIVESVTALPNEPLDALSERGPHQGYVLCLRRSSSTTGQTKGSRDKTLRPLSEAAMQ